MNSMHKNDLFLGSLLNDNFSEVVAMPVQNDRSIYLDIVFRLASDKAIAISGNDHIGDDGDDVFSLVAYDFKQEGWWSDQCEWLPEYVINRSDIENLALLRPKRDIQLYTSQRLQNARPEKNGVWSLIEAMEIRSISDDTCISIVASESHPCAISIFLEKGRTASRFKQLIPIE